MKVYLETMGCQMNRLDSELVRSHLQVAGHEMTDSPRQADVILYNTCSVRRHAEHKVHSRLGADRRRKSARGGTLIVGVLGCMAQREGANLRRRHPHVDIVCGPGQLPQLPALIESAATGRPAVALDPARGDPRPGEIDTLDLARDPRATGQAGQAQVRVMRGCDKFCTYCIVPFVRGAEVSRRPDHIVRESRRLLDAGVTEITLLGQTVNSYRWLGSEATVRFSDLLAMISALSGLRRLRFVTSHPLDFGDDILEAMRDLPNVCEYIHCPAQSGSDAVLKRMNRRYTRAEYDDLIDRARRTVPEVVFAGDFIVGFPGETEADHAASADLIRRTGYKNSFIFKYSPRPGTPAARRLDDDVPEDVKKRRNQDLLAAQAEVGIAHHRERIGQRLEILVEGPSRRFDKQPRPPTEDSVQLTGRTRGGHIVVFDGRPDLVGQYVHIHITDATELALLGELARENDA